MMEILSIVILSLVGVLSGFNTYLLLKNRVSPHDTVPPLPGLPTPRRFTSFANTRPRPVIMDDEAAIEALDGKPRF